jgi:hypothetical protein
MLCRLTLCTHAAGTKGTFACDLGNQLVGDPTTVCLTSGNWSKVSPTCKIVDYGTKGNPARTCKDAYAYLVDRLEKVRVVHSSKVLFP